MPEELLIVGTALETRGGVASVLRAWKENGLFDRWSARFIATNASGGALKKAGRALTSFFVFASRLLFASPRLVHIHLSSYSSFWRKTPFLALTLLFGKPLVISLHGGAFQEFYAGQGNLGKAWIRLLMRRAERFLVLTESWRQWVERTEPAARVRVIPNPGPQLPELSSMTQPARQIVLFLGRISREKGVFDLIQAFANIKAACPAATLVCGGEGDIAGASTLAKSLGIDSAISFVGWLDEPGKVAWLKQATIFVLPSYIENLPVSILEAFAYGMPVVASNVGGVPDVLSDGEDGLLIQPGDIDGLQAAVIALLSNTEQRSSMGQRARVKAESIFAPDIVISKVDELYREILGIDGSGAKREPLPIIGSQRP